MGGAEGGYAARSHRPQADELRGRVGSEQAGQKLSGEHGGCVRRDGPRGKALACFFSPCGGGCAVLVAGFVAVDVVRVVVLSCVLSLGLWLCCDFFLVFSRPFILGKLMRRTRRR